MNRLALGAALGGLAAYLYDPESGAQRRDRLSAMWQENRDNAMQAGRAASDTIDSARPFARRVSRAVANTDWASALERRPTASVPKLMGAAAVGGVLVYFMDPTKGSQRRMSAMDAGRRAVNYLVAVVQPLPSQVGSRVTDAVAGVRSKVG
jgi:hypothetical protein